MVPYRVGKYRELIGRKKVADISAYKSKEDSASSWNYKMMAI